MTAPLASSSPPPLATSPIARLACSAGAPTARLGRRLHHPYPFDAQYDNAIAAAAGADAGVEEEIAIESERVPIRHVSGGYSPSPFSPESESNGPVLPPPTEMGPEEGVLLREWRSSLEQLVD